MKRSMLIPAVFVLALGAFSEESAPQPAPDAGARAVKPLPAPSNAKFNSVVTSKPPLEAKTGQALTADGAGHSVWANVKGTAIDSNPVSSGLVLTADGLGGANWSPVTLSSPNNSLTVTAGTGLAGGGVVPLGGNVTLSLGSNLALAGVTTGTFAGDGSGLTGLNASSLTGNLSVTALANSSIIQVSQQGYVPESPASGVAVSGNYAYFSSSNDGMYIIDISNPASPVVEANVPESAMGNGGVQAVAISGNYAYLANSNAGLYIVDVSNPLSPVVKANVPETAMGNGSAIGVAISGNYAYIANYEGLRIIDISNPASPVLKTNVPESAMGNGNLNAVAVSGNYAYLANDIDGLRIIDISNPASPVIKANVPESAMGNGVASAVAVSSNYAYLVNYDDGLRIIDISNPLSPVVKANVPIIINNIFTIPGVAVSGNYAYFAASDEGLYIIDISNPVSPVVSANIQEDNAIGNGYADSVAVSGNYIYLDNYNDGLRIFSLATPSVAPTELNLGSAQLIAAGGNVGIGRTPTFNKLEIEGAASKTIASGWVANSDRRIKQDIQTVDHALETLDKVRLVDFRYTDAYRREHPVIADTRYMNVIAQEFAEVFPDHVKGSGEKLSDGSEILQVDTYPLTIYSAAGVQELHRETKALRAENAELKKRLAEQEAKNNANDARLLRLERALGSMGK